MPPPGTCSFWMSQLGANWGVNHIYWFDLGVCGGGLRKSHPTCVFLFFGGLRKFPEAVIPPKLAGGGKKLASTSHEVLHLPLERPLRRRVQTHLRAQREPFHKIKASPRQMSESPDSECPSQPRLAIWIQPALEAFK